MSDDNKFYLPAILIIIAFTLWIGWYTIIPVIIIAFCFSIYHYIDSKNKAKTMKEKGIYYNRMTVGEVILSSVIISVVGLIFIAVCMLFKSCVNDDGPGYDKIERRTKIHTIDGDKMPTMSEHGEYHNAGTGERQIEYGGSIEQKRDLEAADRLIESGH